MSDENITTTTTAATAAPATSTTTNNDRLVAKVLNAWQTSNTMGLTADVLQSSRDMDGMTIAYAEMVQDVLSPTTSNKPMNRHLNVVQESFEILGLMDSPCPGTAPDARCQSIYGQFELYYSGDNGAEEQEDKDMLDELQQEYTMITQLAIDEGLLQQELEDMDDESVWFVEGAVDPVLPTQGLIPMKPAAATTMDATSEQPQQEQPQQTTVSPHDTISPHSSSIPNTPNTPVLPPPMEDTTDSSNDVISNSSVDKAKALQLSMGISATVVLLLGLLLLVRLLQRQRQERQQREQERRKDVSESQTLLDDDMYQETIEELVQQRCPEHKHHVNALLQQFRGREEDLIALLQNSHQWRKDDDNKKDTSNLDKKMPAKQNSRKKTLKALDERDGEDDGDTMIPTLKSFGSSGSGGGSGGSDNEYDDDANVDVVVLNSSWAHTSARLIEGFVLEDLHDEEHEDDEDDDDDDDSSDSSMSDDNSMHGDDDLDDVDEFASS